MIRILILATITIGLPSQAPADEFKRHPKTIHVGPFPTSIAAGDLNGDTIPEIVTTNRGHLDDPAEEIPAGNYLSYLTATTPLEYTTQPQLRTGFGPYAIKLANIDALKAKDLVVVNFMATRNRDLTLLRNLGDNLFESIHFSVTDDELQYRQHNDGLGKPIFTTPGLTELVVEDFDGDGYRDVVATGWSSDILAYFPGTIEGYFGKPVITEMPGGPRDIVVHDFDHDGKKDLAVLAYSTHELVMLKSMGKGVFQEINRFVTRGKLPVSLAIGDMNGDGKEDLVVAHSHADDSAIIFYQDKSFQFSITQEIMLEPDRNKLEYGIRDVHIIDMNQDGMKDIALACSQAQQVVILLNSNTKGISGKAFKREKYTFKKGRPHALASADFNLDGKIDLAVTLWEENRIAFLLHR
jgi:hypothetical protein